MSGAAASSPSSSEQYRPVFLLCYPSGKFKSHWAFFIPEIDDRSVKKGKLIHVTGSVRDGFTSEVKRNYDLKLTKTMPYTPIELGIASTQHLVDTVLDNRYSVDREAQDAFEALVLSVPAPQSSLNKASGVQEQSGPPRRPKLSDCQWWITTCVEKLVAEGYLLPSTRGIHKGKSPLTILEAAPKH